jgi:hypothetical protein
MTFSFMRSGSKCNRLRPERGLQIEQVYGFSFSDVQFIETLWVGKPKSKFAVEIKLLKRTYNIFLPMTLSEYLIIR